MIKKIKRWQRKQYYRGYEDGFKFACNQDTSVQEYDRKYSKEQLQNAFKIGYTDGKRDGLSIAREQATHSLKEILKQQNGKT